MSIYIYVYAPLCRLSCICIDTHIPAVPHKAVAQVPKIRHYRSSELLWCMDGRVNPPMGVSGYYLSVYSSDLRSVCLSMELSFYLFVYVFFCLSIYLSVCLPVYLSFSTSQLPEARFAPQWCALFRHLNVPNCSETVSVNFTLLNWKCALHSDGHFFRHLNFQKWPETLSL